MEYDALIWMWSDATHVQRLDACSDVPWKWWIVMSFSSLHTSRHSNTGVTCRLSWWSSTRPRCRRSHTSAGWDLRRLHVVLSCLYKKQNQSKSEPDFGKSTHDTNFSVCPVTKQPIRAQQLPNFIQKDIQRAIFRINKR